MRSTSRTKPHAEREEYGPVLITGIFYAQGVKANVLFFDAQFAIGN